MEEENEYREERLNARARRKAQRPRRDACEFCGTDDPSHNVKRREHHGKPYMLCDNPVCNAVTDVMPVKKGGRQHVAR